MTRPSSSQAALKVARVPDHLRPPRVALVHDFLLDLRGADRAFLQLCQIWPDAPIFTALYSEEGTEGRFAGRDVRTSILQRLRPSERTFRALLPLYPAAIESLDLSGYELVVSSSSAWAHGVVCDQQAVHVSYCYNPFRYAWNERDRTLARVRNPIMRALLRDEFHRWRGWDRQVARRTDRYIAISRVTQARIRKYFERDAPIIYPPVDTERFAAGSVGTHYALVSELMPHKRIDIAIQAFNRLRLPLIVIGDGPSYRWLRRLAGPTITFAGRVSDHTVAHVLQTARALIVTAVEEFGLVSVEGQAAGRPVIARRGGGSLETVTDGVTGAFWSGGPDELAQTVLRFDDSAVDPVECTRNAARFGVARFREELLAQVDEASSVDAPLRPVREPLTYARIVKRASRAGSR